MRFIERIQRNSVFKNRFSFDDGVLIVAVAFDFPQSVISSICCLCRSSMTGTESHPRGHMAPVESSVMMLLVASFMEEDAARTGLLSIVSASVCVCQTAVATKGPEGLRVIQQPQMITPNHLEQPV